MTLVEKLFREIREEIFSGGLPLGHEVPSLRMAARDRGVSLRVVREAYVRLVREGWLRARPGVGYIAATPDIPAWRGRVLLLTPNGGYHPDYAAQAFVSAMEKAGYAVGRVVLADPEENLVALEAALYERPDFVFSLFVNPMIENELRHSGIPYAVATGRDRVFGDRSRTIRSSHVPAAQALARLCVEKGVRSARLCCHQAPPAAYAKELMRVGVQTETVQVEVVRRTLWFEDIRRIAMEHFLSLSAREVRRLPDLLVFVDDFFAEGALSALAERGISSPRDVRIATFANWGRGPVYPRELTRFEVNPFEAGKRMADFVLALLNGEKHVRPPVLGPRLVRGETL